MSVSRYPIDDEAAWLERRKGYVTASAIGALFGCHPYTSALRLYVEKSGCVDLPAPQSAVLRRGRLLESSVAAAVAEQRPTWRLEKCFDFYADDATKVGCTPDYLIHGDARGLGVLQCKTVAPSVFAREWTEADPPFWITLQCLTEIMLTDAAFGVVAALVVDPFNLVCPLYEVPRHTPSEARVVEAVAAFWRDMADGKTPGPDYGQDRDLIAMLAPKETPSKPRDLSGDNEIVAGLRDRAELKALIKEYAARCEAIEAAIMHKMGDADHIVGVPDFRVTWKTEHRKAYTVQAKDNRVLRITDRREHAA